MERKIKILNTNEIIDYTEEKEHELINGNVNYTILSKCDDCGNYHPEDELTYITDKDYYVCDDCLNSSYFYCEDCECWYSQDTSSYTTRDGRTICGYCRFDNYTECCNCGEIIPSDQAYYCDDCDEYFCDDCWDDHSNNEHNDGLYDYHAFNDWHPTKLNDEPTPAFYIGHELEIDEGYDRREAIELIRNKINAICMHDGSLDEDSGIEIISHPLSYNYMLSKENEYRQLFTSLTRDFNYRSHETNTCGLHFHVTRPSSEEIIDRILLFMETYKEEIIRLSRRTSDEISSWANFLSDKRTTDEKTIKSLDYIKKNKETSSRYMALNLTNTRTIEFRIFKGTLKYETFMADFEFVYNLTTLASDLSLPIEELTWEKVVSTGHFLPQYIEEHDLHSDKPIHDYTQEVIVERNKQVDKILANLKANYKKIVKSINEMTNIDFRKQRDLNNALDTTRLVDFVNYLELTRKDWMLLNRDRLECDDCTINGIEGRANIIKERMN